MTSQNMTSYGMRSRPRSPVSGKDSTRLPRGRLRAGRSAHVKGSVNGERNQPQRDEGKARRANDERPRMETRSGEGQKANLRRHTSRHLQLRQEATGNLQRTQIAKRFRWLESESLVKLWLNWL